MSDDIIVTGIRTNNLKNISVRIKKHKLNLIIGPSGSGKSSLAYDTVAQIGMNALGAMYNDAVDEPQYRVDSFSNFIVTVPIKQINTNNNTRSSIGTYFSLSPCLVKIYASLLGMPYDYFILNKSENICPKCSGLGYLKILDPNKIVDFNKTLEQVPFRCWSRNKDFYRQIIRNFCDEEGIPSNTKYKDLTVEQQKKMLNGVSKQKYRIKYKVTNHYSTRTTNYYGPLSGEEMLKDFSPSAQFMSESPCNECNGEKYEIGHREYKICGLSIGELLNTPLEHISNWIMEVRSKYDCSNIEFSLSTLDSFIKKAVALNVGYLFLNRNIPSLSGGELQRLRLVQVFCTQLTDLLIVLDEPLAGLSKMEKTVVYRNVIQLLDRHTLLIIDHHDVFIKDAANIIALGEGSGIYGGNIVDANMYMEKQNIQVTTSPPPVDTCVRIIINNDVYSFKGVNLLIAQERMNIITGESGVGKTTVLREFLPRKLDNYVYISQKPLVGNSRSTVATYMNISNGISKYYARFFKKEISFFSNSSTGKGSCKFCGGTGFIQYGSDAQSQIELMCQDCNGTGFDKKLNKYLIDGKSIIDVWKMTISEAADFFENKNEKILQPLRIAQSLLLGHLNLSEKISALSGGENLRLRLIEVFTSSNGDVFGVDEPFKGLNNTEKQVIINAFNSLIDKKKTVIVVDHEEDIISSFSKHIELINENGVLIDSFEKANL